MRKAWLSLCCCLLAVPTALGQEPGEFVVMDELPMAFDAPADDTRLYATGEYLLWWVKDAPVPVPLVLTGGSASNLSPQLGQPGVVTLLGGSDLGNDMHSGGRFTAGYWLNRERSVAVEGNYFFLGSRSAQQSVASNAAPGSLLLTLPFFDPTTQSESSTRIALPGGFQGSAAVSVDSRLQGFEANALANVVDRSRFRLDVLTGFRYLDLQENLNFATNSVTVIGPPDVFRTLDSFSAGNQFYGGQLGFKLQHTRGRCTFGSTVKVALGAMHETVQINGGLATNDFNGLGPVQLFPGGYLTAPTNIGKQTEDRFAVVPQVDLNVGYDVTRHARLLFGYSFLYLSDVVRPGDQINRVINPTQLPAISGNMALVGPAQPAPLFQPSEFWAQGLNFGLQLHF